MRRCLEIARLGAGYTAPNPMVGCVIVHEGKIIGEGYHMEYGGPHAEVHAIRSVSHPELLRKSTLYVNLEPCSHFGKTPPCADLILQSGIPRVVIGTMDPNEEVSGRGIEKLRSGGVLVETGVLQAECRWVNRRFFTWHEKKRPYVILKWAQTLDGFIDALREPGLPVQPVWISNELSRRLVHKYRTEVSSILIGTNTALNDNPSLTVRSWSGKSPLRLVIDRKGRLPGNLNVFDGTVPTLVFTEKSVVSRPGVEFVTICFESNSINGILSELYQRKIQSLLVEGGAYTLQQFIDSGLWDEARIFSGSGIFGAGTPAPRIAGTVAATEFLDDNRLSVLLNKESTYRL